MGAKLKPMKKLNLLNPTTFNMLESEIIKEGDMELRAKLFNEIKNNSDIKGAGEVLNYYIDDSNYFTVECVQDTFTYLFNTADVVKQSCIDTVVDNMYGVDRETIGDVLGIDNIDGVELDLVDEKSLMSYFDANPEQAKQVAEHVFDVKGYSIDASYDGIAYEFNYNGTDYVMYRWD